MQADNFTNGGGPGLDELLKQSFLDLDQSNPVNDQLFDMASQNVFGREWPVEVDAQREAQLTKKITKASKWPWYLGGIGAAGIIATATILLWNNNEKSVDNNIVNTSDKTQITQEFSPLTNKITNNEKQESYIASYEKDAKQTTPHGVDDLSGKRNIVDELSNNQKRTVNNSSNGNNNTSTALSVADPNLLNNSANANVNTTDGNTVATNVPAEKTAGNSKLPVLSEQQTEETKKDIQKLVFDLTSNLVYNYVPVHGVSSTGYNNKAWYSSFNLKATEVTVKEYSLFLNDLILNGKQDEYEKARPKVEEMFGGTLSADDKKFFDSYFTSPSYKNYPMVLITPEAANMYCAWLQELMIKNSHGKFSQMEIRLPYESEWLKAAGGGNSKGMYATDNGKIKKWKSYKANFKETQQRRFDFLNEENSTAAPGADDKDDKDNFNYFTCNVRKYEPNGSGLYNMSGNVSEMVVDKHGKVMARGGNWNSPKEYLSIKKEDIELFNEFPMGAQASPYIGFRPLIIFK